MLCLAPPCQLPLFWAEPRASLQQGCALSSPSLPTGKGSLRRGTAGLLWVCSPKLAFDPEMPLGTWRALARWSSWALQGRAMQTAAGKRGAAWQAG